jgi:hypothetical protein
MFLCYERNVHCFEKICFKASRKEVKMDVLKIGFEQSLKLEKQFKNDYLQMILNLDWKDLAAL